MRLGIFWKTMKGVGQEYLLHSEPGSLISASCVYLNLTALRLSRTTLSPQEHL